MAYIGRVPTAVPLAVSDIPDLPTSKITSGTFADARIAASNVSQHATSFDDDKIVNDLSTLGLRVHSQENLIASNTSSSSFDVFQDSSGISANTNAPRNASGEFISTVVQSTTNFVTTLHRTSDYTGSISTPSFGSADGSTMQNAPASGNSGKYAGVMVNELWDLSQDFTCRGFFTNTNGSGTLDGVSFMAVGMLITTNTSLTAGSDPDIFEASSANQWYGNDNQWASRLTSAGDTGTGVASLSTSYANGNTNRSIDLSNAGLIVGHYYNDGGTDEAGFIVENDRSANTLTIKSLDTSAAARNEGVVTMSNVPATGRALIAFGDASGNRSRMFSTNYNNGNSSSNLSSKVSVTENATGNFTSTTITSSSSVSKMGAVITYQDNAGTNTLNTDIVLKLSADNGSNFSTATLTALPDFATGIKMAKVNDLSVTAGTQLKYKIEFANQALGSKEARIRGVSLQY